MTPVAGTTVAERFRLVRPLGQGGMGSVWLAQHTGLDVPCAVKFIHAEGDTTTEEIRVRFEREAKIAAQLRSPHVVQIFDHGVWDGAPYIAMEYLDGEDLDDRLGRVGRLGARDTAIIIAQVSRALARAHAAGLVHRDLKPANIYIVRDDDREIVKVLDFGIAKDVTPRVATTTKTGSLLGTPAYMSPEQAQGTKHVDHRSDLWSLAVVVYECMTGQLPFNSEAFGDLLLKIMVHPLPVPSAIAPVPIGFDAWWARAAARDPDARFQSAKEMADALVNALGISTADASERSSISDVFAAPSSTGSGPFLLGAYSKPVPILFDNPRGEGVSEARTLVAPDSGRKPEAIQDEPSGVTPGARPRHQTAAGVVSSLTPKPKQGFGRVVAGAAAGVLVAGIAGFFVVRSVESAETGGATEIQGDTPQAIADPPPAPANPAPAVAPDAPPPAPAPTGEPAVEPAHAGAPAPSASPGTKPSAPPATPAIRSTAQTAAPVPPRPTPPPADSGKRKPKPTDFGI